MYNTINCDVHVLPVKTMTFYLAMKFYNAQLIIVYKLTYLEAVSG